MRFSIAQDYIGQLRLKSADENREISDVHGVSFHAYKALFLAIAVVAILIFRRPDQLLNPAIWVEDGSITLPQYIAHGWLSIVYPVQGYIVLPSKIIFIISTKLSFLYQPEISYMLTVLFTFGVVASIAFSPTYLKCRFLCALAVLLVPTDSEVFGVPEYAFWWGTLLCVVPLLWRVAGKPRTVVRVSMTLLGGLSSPLVVAISPLYALRLLRYRARHDAMVLGAAIAASFTQTVTMLNSVNLGGLPNLSGKVLGAVVSKFFGNYLLCCGSRTIISIVGACVLLIVIGTIVRIRKRLQFEDLLLFLCLAASIGITVLRVPLGMIHPASAGPRYFFFPFIFLSWTLLQLAARGDRAVRVLVLVILLLGLRQTASLGQRFHDRINWRTEVMECARCESYELPIHSDGNRERLWHVRVSGAACRQLISDSLFSNSPELR